MKDVSSGPTAAPKIKHKMWTGEKFFHHVWVLHVGFLLVHQHKPSSRQLLLPNDPVPSIIAVTVAIAFVSPRRAFWVPWEVIKRLLDIKIYMQRYEHA